MRTRGKFLKKQIWFSICSMHAAYDENCNMCNHGSWENVIHYKISSVIYKFFPSLWRWWLNRKVINNNPSLWRWWLNRKNHKAHNESTRTNS